MEVVVIYIALVLLGLCLGSFAGASLWRQRARHLAEDKARGDEYDKREYKQLKKLTTAPLMRDRSQCLHCSYTLRWYDLVPLVSWLSLRGKCRKCRRPIGHLEPLIELGVALYFVLSFAFWPYQLESGLDIARLAIWLIAGVGLAILFAYDQKWSLLPDKVNFTVIGLGAISAVIVTLQADDMLTALASIGGSIIILSGVYWLLYIVSQGRWIGFGDIKLGLGLALLLADFRLAFIAIFAANLIGCLVVIPAMIAGKLRRNAHVPFGPLLIIGAFIAQLTGLYLVDMYLGGLL
jgi:prepilin signal peptidase PulO-like enzyme (type II secretory pathway)